MLNGTYLVTIQTNKNKNKFLYRDVPYRFFFSINSHTSNDLPRQAKDHKLYIVSSLITHLSLASFLWDIGIMR